jgi:hypothetical protein
MIGNRKLMFVAMVLAVSIAPPAFAQSTDHIGSPMPYYYDSTGGQMRGSWAPQVSQATPGSRPAATRRNGSHAYAMTPRSHRSYGR